METAVGKAGNSQINVSLDVINLQSLLWGRVVLASSTRMTPCPLKGPGLHWDRWVPGQQGHKGHIGAGSFAFCWWKRKSVTACGTGRTGGALAWASLAQSPLPLHLWMQLQSPAGSGRGHAGAGSGRAQGEPEPCSGPSQTQIQHEPQYLILLLPPAVEARRLPCSALQRCM